MTDEKLLEEILKRLGDNFYENKKPYYHEGKLCAITNSEEAADALEETLYNMGLDDICERTDEINLLGCWEAKFAVKKSTSQEKRPWYTENWDDDDLESALEGAGVPITEENIHRLRIECSNIFKDKSERNEMIVQRVRKVFDL